MTVLEDNIRSDQSAPDTNINECCVKKNDEESVLKARDLVKKFPVTKDMFPSINTSQTVILCK